MPFNKGDFTQQGVAGHVNANIRLNEKRLVNIDLTSNEEAEGCTIAGTVTDLLNDKVYNIGSGGGGGGTDVKTMPITIINNTTNNVFLEVPSLIDSGYLVGGIEIPANDTATVNANIYYGESDELYFVLLNGATLSAQDAEYDEVNSTASYATLDFDGAYCEIDLTSPPNPDAAATIYIIDAN